MIPSFKSSFANNVYGVIIQNISELILLVCRTQPSNLNFNPKRRNEIAPKRIINSNWFLRFEPSNSLQLIFYLLIGVYETAESKTF